MKFVSLTSVTVALWCGSLRSSRRAAVSPPKPPPRITTFQAMRPRLPLEQQRRPFAAVAPVALGEPVAAERGRDLAGLLAQQAGQDHPLRRASHARRHLEQQRADE